MPKSYSTDLRERVIAAVEMGASRHEAADRFEVSVSTVVKTAQSFAVRAATANIPPGPQHDQLVHTIGAQAIQQTNSLLNQVFTALKESLAVAIQHGFIAVLIFCGATILVTFFLNDIPLSTASAYMASQADSDDTQNESSKGVETTA